MVNLSQNSLSGAIRESNRNNDVGHGMCVRVTRVNAFSVFLGPELEKLPIKGLWGTSGCCRTTS